MVKEQNKKINNIIEYLIYFQLFFLPIFDILEYLLLEGKLKGYFAYVEFLKYVIPFMLMTYYTVILKGKERKHFVISNISCILLSLVLVFVYNKNAKSVINLASFYIIYNIYKKVFYRKNLTKLRMTLNYMAGIYLLSILLLTFVENKEIGWNNKTNMVLSILLFTLLVSIRYKEDRNFSIMIFIITFAYYITTINIKENYIHLLFIFAIYAISILFEKYINNKLNFKKIRKDVNKNISKIIFNIISKFENKNTVKKLTKHKINKYYYIPSNIKYYRKNNLNIYTIDTIKRIQNVQKKDKNISNRYSKKSSLTKRLTKEFTKRIKINSNNEPNNNKTFNLSSLYKHKKSSNEEKAKNKYDIIYSNNTEQYSKYDYDQIIKKYNKQSSELSKKKTINKIKQIFFKNRNKNNQIKKQPKNKKNLKLKNIVSLIFKELILIFLFYIMYKILRKYVPENIYEILQDTNEFRYKFIYYLPIIAVSINILRTIIFKLQKVDSEFLILSTFVYSLLIYLVLSKDAILGYTASNLIAVILISVINKIKIGNTCRDIDSIKEKLIHKNDLTCKKKILIGINSLSLEGVTTATLDLVRGLIKKYPFLEIDIFTIFNNKNEDFLDDLKNSVNIISVFKKPIKEYSRPMRTLIYIYLNLFEFCLFDNYIKGNYDTIIAVDEEYILRLLSYNDDQSNKIVWIQNKRLNIYNRENRKKINKMQQIYSCYDKIIFSNEHGIRNFNRIFKTKKLRQKEKQYIPIYISSVRVLEKAQERPSYVFSDKTINFITVVRLYKHKKIDRLIDVAAKLKQNGKPFAFYIIGNGPEKSYLAKKVKELKLENEIIFLGTKKNPYKYIKQADYFCLFSGRENQSIILKEASVLNKKILMTDLPTKETIKGYPMVEIVPNNEQGVYKALKGAIDKFYGYDIYSYTTKFNNLDYIVSQEKILKDFYNLI